MSQHIHQDARISVEYDSKSLKSTFLRHSISFSGYSCMVLFTGCRGFFFSKIAMEGWPSLPARPVACIYPSTFSGGPTWIIWRMSGQSMPSPKATVAITTLSVEFGDVKDANIWFFTPSSVHDVNMSTNRNFDRFGASVGYIKFDPNCVWKRT